MLRFVYRPVRVRGGKRVRGRVYRGRYRLAGDAKASDVALRTVDKRVAERRLDHLVEDVEREREGILPPKPMRDAAQRRLSEHLAELVRDLKARGRCAGYVYRLERRVRKLVRACGWAHPKDVTRESFVTWRGGAAESLSSKTLNDYLSAANVLLKWMQDQGRIAANPLGGKSLRVETKGRRKFKRRALTDAEVGALLGAAGRRRALYLTAVQTGLRRGELKALRWSDLYLEGPAGFVSARAATTKNRKDAVLGLPAELVGELRALRVLNGAKDGLVFRMPDYETVRRDFERAGITWGVDVQGRRVDFHALRHTFVTNLGRGGVSALVRRLAARHSDQRLTDGVYNDATQLPVVQAAEALPAFLSAYSLIDSLALYRTGHGVAQPDAGASGAAERKSLSDKGRGHKRARGGTTGLAAGKNSPSRTRTYNNPVNSRVLYH